MKQKRFSIIMVVCVLCLLTACGNGGRGENITKKAGKDETTAVAESTESEEATETAKKSKKKKESETKKAKEKTTKAAQEEEDDNPYHKITDLEAVYQREFGHAFDDSVYLGTEERMTLTVKATGKKLEEDDLLVADSERILDIELTDKDVSDKSASFTYTIKGKKSGSTSLLVASKYDIYNEDQEKYLGVEMRILDKTEGRTVYYTIEGERYHYKESCAGENARPTTLYDAESVGRTPCGTCAK